MTTAPIAPIVDKLRKLIAHEKSARAIGNLQEAEAFAARIQDILTAHKLSMSEVELQDRESTEPIDWERVDDTDAHTHSKRFNVYWKIHIASAIAKVNSCQFVKHSNSGGKSFSFVGRTSDRELAKILYIYLVELGDELCYKDDRRAREIQGLRFNLEHGIADFSVPSWAKSAFQAHMKASRESWLTGFSEAIYNRFIARYEETLQAQAQTASNAIVHINRDIQAVKDFLKGKVRASRRVPINNSRRDGYERGSATGNAVNLSPNRFQGATGRASRLLGA